MRFDADGVVCIGCNGVVCGQRRTHETSHITAHSRAHTHTPHARVQGETILARLTKWLKLAMGFFILGLNMLRVVFILVHFLS